ncbi:uncharacterized protein LOC134227096 [Armigeres subalbatus]|uniref:uncharacterized protein LOC134227096 n=1 Tax=Armigeres subalbatus TaxID=124917 RepID=UPI002ED271F6
MKFLERFIAFTFISLLCAEIVLSQTPGYEYEYEYYYEDEITTTTKKPVTTTTARRSTTTRRRNGQYASATTKRSTSQKYQASRPDVILNIISDMYGLSNMGVNGRQGGYGGQRYTSNVGYGRYSNRYSSRYGSPIEYWYTMRPGSSGSAKGRQPAIIDYGGDYDDDYYTDYYDYYYNSRSPPRTRSEAQRRGSNRALFNFMLNTLYSRRRR